MNQIKNMEKIKHNHKCQRCGKPATWNLQNAWHLYQITPNGDFTESNSWEGDENNFFCDECCKKELT
ncbi:hypothetical protein KY314_01710 [Candidatus Woesearchaeota archaeon]|nr:hypothetical protein [Candidatus Woesearchaeota archaeon]